MNNVCHCHLPVYKCCRATISMLMLIIFSYHCLPSSDTSPLLSNDHMFETMVVELEELLARLTRINDKMMDYTHNLGK